MSGTTKNHRVVNLSIEDRLAELAELLLEIAMDEMDNKDE